MAKYEEAPARQGAQLVLAPLRGVTIRTFRETFASEIRAAGFTEAVTPFVPAAPGYDPLKDRELRPRTLAAEAECAAAAGAECAGRALLVTPQFIGKDPAALREALKRVRDAGFAFADLNCGCPFPMIRKKGRGSGLLRTPDVLKRMLEAGCDVMGAGRFSAKTRLGIERSDELAALMDLFNAFPLRRLVVHARTAVQMYSGQVDRPAFEEVLSLAKMPVIFNGDAEMPTAAALHAPGGENLMIGRAFIRSLGAREDAPQLLARYIAASKRELFGDRPVLGRIKELLAYWKDLPRWRRLWPFAKLARSTDELATLA